MILLTHVATSSMLVGVAVALAWMIAGKVLGGNPLGLHGFIPGVLVSLAVFVLVSLFTKPPEAALIRRAWGEE